MDSLCSPPHGTWKPAEPADRFLRREFERARREMRSFDMVQGFVSHLHSAGIDWETVGHEVPGAPTVEEAVGRAAGMAGSTVPASTTALRPVPTLTAVDAEEEFFAFNALEAEPDFGDGDRLYATLASARDALTFGPLKERTVSRVAGVMSRHRTAVTFALSALMIAVFVGVAVLPNVPSTPAAYNTPSTHGIQGNAGLIPASTTSSASGTAASSGAGTASPSTPAAANLPPATSQPAPAPPSLAGATPLRSHEVFGFAPYWTLSQSAGFDVSQLSTIAYFSVGVNADGTINESGAGWQGYQSQALVDLITRAHAAGDRVVLTVSIFDQKSLDELTSSATAPETLARSLIWLIVAKNLDGVNLDFEGTGSADQAGLTNLVTAVSAAVHGANSRYQVTMDTYASSAGDPNGFYDIKALAPAVDAFFVMDYELNLQSAPAASSPLTSGNFSISTSIDQYAAAVPSSKVILGLPFFGVDWPTTDGTLDATATGPATYLSDAQVTASGHPIYWDSVTDTGWTSYQVGTQWHETFFEVPTGLYDAAHMAQAANLAGVGIWALGMDADDASMMSALLGFSPAAKNLPSGPGATTPSVASTTSATATTAGSTTTSTSGRSGSPGTSGTSGTPGTETTTTETGSTTTSTGDAGSGLDTSVPPDFPTPSSTTSSTSTTTSSTSATTSTSEPTVVESPSDTYSGTWNGAAVTLTPAPSSTVVSGSPAGSLTSFATSNPAATCLSSSNGLPVYPVPGQAGEYVVATNEPTDCVSTFFTFTTGQ